MTGLLFTIAWFPLVGLAVSRISRGMNPFLAGVGANGALLFLAGVMHVPLVATVVAIATASFLVLMLLLRRVSPARPRVRHPLLADIALGFFAAVLLFVSAISPLTDYDGRAFWLLKAKAIVHEQSIDGPFFHGRAAVNPRNEYPLLMPLDAATVMMVAREADERHVRWLYALVAIAFAFELRRRLGGWFGALLLAIPQVAIAGEGGALSAYADLALAAFAGCAVLELASEHPSALRAGLWLSFMVLTKNEGLPFAAIVLLTGAYMLRKRVVVAAIPFATAAAALFLWRSRIEPTDELSYFIRDLPERLERLPEAVTGFARYVVSFSGWGVFWIVAAVAAAVLVVQRRWKTLWIAAMPAAAMTLLYLIIYIVTDWKTSELVETTAPRLLTHLVGPAMLIIATWIPLPDGELHADRNHD